MLCSAVTGPPHPQKTRIHVPASERKISTNDRMRAPLITLVLICTAAAQSTSPPIIVGVDDPGGAIRDARISIPPPPQPPFHCLPDFNGRSQFPSLPAGPAQIHL